MSRGGFKITRCSDEGTKAEAKRESVPDWMREFAAKSEQYVQSEDKVAVTVVDRGRERQQSIYHQMFSVMNGKAPLYHTVDEAVSDYQKKTGLTEHLRRTQAETVKSAALYVLASGAYDDDSDETTTAGTDTGSTIEGGQDVSFDEMLSAKDKKKDDEDDEDEEESKEESEETEEGAFAKFLKMLDDKDSDSDSEDVLVISIDGDEEDDLKKKEITEGNPDIFKVIKDFDGFANTLVSSNPKLSLPAIMSRVKDTFSEKCSDNEFEDPKLENYFKKLIEQFQTPDYENYALMGRDLDAENMEGSEDPFFVLRPDNKI